VPESSLLRHEGQKVVEVLSALEKSKGQSALSLPNLVDVDEDDCRARARVRTVVGPRRRRASQKLANISVALRNVADILGAGHAPERRHWLAGAGGFEHLHLRIGIRQDSQLGGSRTRTCALE
jgi:hypothetical protein